MNFICLILFYCKFYDLLKLEINMFISKLSNNKINEVTTNTISNKKIKNNIKINILRNSNKKNLSKKNSLFNDIKRQNFLHQKEKRRKINKEIIKILNIEKKSNNDSEFKIINKENNKIDYTDYEL